MLAYPGISRTSDKLPFFPRVLEGKNSIDYSSIFLFSLLFPGLISHLVDSPALFPVVRRRRDFRSVCCPLSILVCLNLAGKVALLIKGHRRQEFNQSFNSLIYILDRSYRFQHGG